MKKTLFILLISFLMVGTARAALPPIKSTVEIDTFTANGPITNNEDYYGYGADEIGDFDGDGIIDIVVGAWGSDVGGLNRGSVHISLLNSDGSVKSTVVINDLTPNGPILDNSDSYGISVAPLGDLDGDGVTDIIAGTWADDAGGSNRGGVHIHFLNADGSVKSTTEINSLTPNGPILNNADIYGVDVASMGDFDGDGVTDIIVGAFSDDTGGSGRGAVHISLLNSNGSVKSTTKITSLTPNGPLLANGYSYGRGVTTIGDLDGDGITDIAVGAEGDTAGGPLRGAVYISFLNANLSVKSTTKISSLTPNGPVLADGDRYGVKTMNLGDLDGDGVTDLGVGSYLDNDGGADSGAFYIHFLNTNGSVKSTQKISTLTPGGASLNAGDLYGTSIVRLGDLNGDGTPDFAVGASANDTGGSNRGKLPIHFFNSFITPPLPSVISPPASSTVYNNQNPTFTGTGSLPANVITIMDGATLIGTGTIAGDNSWSITSIPVLPYASYNFTIYESGVYDGPTVLHPITLVFDIVPPSAPLASPDLQAASDTGISNTDNITSQNLPTFDIQCTEIGSTIILYSDNPAPNSMIGIHSFTLIGTDGATVTVVLTDGIHNISYTETDPAGNESAHSPALAVTIDTSIIPAPVTPIAGGRPPEVIEEPNETIPEPSTDQPPTEDPQDLPENLTCLKKDSIESPFSDISGHFAEDAILLLTQTISTETRVVEGYDSKTGSKLFKPDRYISRAEFLKMTLLSNCLTITLWDQAISEGKEPAKIFLDVPVESDKWYKNYIYSAAEAGIVDGAMDGNFYPEDPITRAEATKILINILNLIDENYTGTKYFNDVSDNEWFFDYVSAGKENHIIEGYDTNPENDGNRLFMPNNFITRAETALILVRIFNLE